jgi:hypothetical protein
MGEQSDLPAAIGADAGHDPVLQRIDRGHIHGNVSGIDRADQRAAVMGRYQRLCQALLANGHLESCFG